MQSSVDVRNCKALTFDFFGTILDLGGSLKPHIERVLRRARSPASGSAFQEQWRARQRLEQYQDSLLMLGHSGYLETARRALVYVFELNRVRWSADDVAEVMVGWRELRPFPEVADALRRLHGKYRLVGLSNGEPWFLEHLAKNQINFEFDAIYSVNLAGVFKPHPAVYRSAAAFLGMEPGELLMVSSNSFDVLGARACGYRGAYVNRYSLPYEDSPYKPDVTVRDFNELADALRAPMSQ
ncbi:MAG: haloacid dehalogenase type II [Chloroflexi bacterium]|nr:haloacid dehalogenase type II [Chloroflexota bacterium]